MIGIATIFSDEWNRLLLTNKVAAAYGTNMNGSSVFSLSLSFCQQMMVRSDHYIYVHKGWIFNPQIMYVRWGTNYGYTIITRMKYALSTSAKKSQETNMPVVRLVYVCLCVCHEPVTSD